MLQRSSSLQAKHKSPHVFTKMGVYVDPDLRAGFLRQQAHALPRNYSQALPQLRLAAYSKVVPSDWKPPPGFAAGVAGAVAHSGWPKQHPPGLATNDWKRIVQSVRTDEERAKGPPPWLARRIAE